MYLSMDIKQLRKPGRERPYVTIVDSGLLMTAQNILAGLYLGVIDPEGDWPTLDGYDPEFLLEVANRLARELADRTF